ncbi:hypothetical protein Pint_29425 [Pistacia integerrima]|uniref:Uncharacterized protein n=1 Tax=Pistacia integerrima TaxID=434235 RepID=A0ACC0X2A6_9ROSI|nr:hypothetical protein Pint_29425 [Pistacia integerrima]
MYEYDEILNFDLPHVINSIAAVFTKLPLIPTFLPSYKDQFIYGVNFASGTGALAETRRGYEIYKIGGRKFGFLNLDDLGSLPLIRAIVPGSSGSCLESVSELAKLHNKALSEVLRELESQLTGFKYAIHDFYNSSLEIINNPSRSGLKETIVACCGSGRYRGTMSCGGMTGIKDYELCDNPEEYMFFDAVHPTEKAYKLIAELMWSGTPNITGPYNLKKLFEHV